MAVQDPTVFERTVGKSHLRAVADGPTGRTVLARLHQAGACKLRLPSARDAFLEAVQINTAGGLTGGDRLAHSAEAGPGAALSLSSQAAERIYRAGSGATRVAVRLDVAAGATLHWLPQETIVFDGAVLHRNLRVDLAPDAHFVGLEAVMLGRDRMGERVTRGELRDDWRVYCSGRLVFADATRLKDWDRLADHALLGDNRAYATVVAHGAIRQADLDEVCEMLTTAAGRGGASVVEGTLVLRLLAPDAETLRGDLSRLLPVITGRPLPRVWSL